jgi:hypothetical protein
MAKEYVNGFSVEVVGDWSAERCREGLEPYARTQAV